MSPLNATLLTLCVIISTSNVSCHARKLCINQEADHQQKKTNSYASLLLTALPKGTTPPSSPSKGHSSTTTTTTLGDEKLFARHLAAIDRILRRLINWQYDMFLPRVIYIDGLTSDTRMNDGIILPKEGPLSAAKGEE
ncbi:hypothetical protein BVRB_8g181250 [Beta vulgaris subsp. vulgaris]|nr:hypothetical protein BVRB_8g181250 [Beta vulgaris subsp. vulgaris]